MVSQKKPQMEHHEDEGRMCGRLGERHVMMLIQGQALMVLSPSTNSILYIPSLVLCLIVGSGSCKSVNCVVVVVRKTIGPFERVPGCVEIFEGIEYDREWEVVARASSELIPRPMRTIISENYIQPRRKKRMRS